MASTVLGTRPSRPSRGLARPRPLQAAALAVLAGLSLATAPPAQALPEGATVTSGQVTAATVVPGSLEIRQTSPSAGLDWRSFSIGAGETVRVLQPGRSAVLLNRVTGGDPSLLLGQLSANGRVFLVNPRGIVFGESARVDVGSLVASTLDLGPAEFAAGRYALLGSAGAAAIEQRGRIVAQDSVVLAAPHLRHSGSTEAGRVAMVAADSALIDIEGDGLIVQARSAAGATRIDASGRITARQGLELVAGSREQLAPAVLNLEGLTIASSLEGLRSRLLIDAGLGGLLAIDPSVLAGWAPLRLDAGEPLATLAAAIDGRRVVPLAATGVVALAATGVVARPVEATSTVPTATVPAAVAGLRLKLDDAFATEAVAEPLRRGEPVATGPLPPATGGDAAAARPARCAPAERSLACR